MLFVIDPTLVILVSMIYSTLSWEQGSIPDQLANVTSMVAVALLVTMVLADRCDPPPGRPFPARIAGAQARPLTLARGGGVITVVPPVGHKPQFRDFWLVARDGRVQIPLRAAGRERYAYPPLPAKSAWTVAEDVTDFLDRPAECRRHARLTIAEARVPAGRR